MMSKTPAPQESSSISPLLKNLAYTPRNVSTNEIASAFSLIFENSLSTVQMAAFLTLLHSTSKDRDPDVLAKCSHRMREAASVVDVGRIMKQPAPKQGTYRGGLVGETLIVPAGSTDSVRLFANNAYPHVVRYCWHWRRRSLNF